MISCEHYACRCARANELAVMAECTGRLEFLAQALQVHEQQVPCRLERATERTTDAPGVSPGAS